MLQIRCQGALNLQGDYKNIINENMFLRLPCTTNRKGAACNIETKNILLSFNPENIVRDPLILRPWLFFTVLYMVNSIKKYFFSNWQLTLSLSHKICAREEHTLNLPGFDQIEGHKKILILIETGTLFREINTNRRKCKGKRRRGWFHLGRPHLLISSLIGKIKKN